MLTHRISADLQHAVSCWMRVVSQYRVFMLVSDDLPESLSWRRHDGDNNNEMISPSMHTPLCWWQDPCFFSDCGWRSFLSVYWLQGRSSFCPYLYSGFGLLIGLPGYRGALRFARIFILVLDFLSVCLATGALFILPVSLFWIWTCFTQGAWEWSRVWTNTCRIHVSPRKK